jgi:hypothetical protein
MNVTMAPITIVASSAADREPAMLTTVDNVLSNKKTEMVALRLSISDQSELINFMSAKNTASAKGPECLE